MGLEEGNCDWCRHEHKAVAGWMSLDETLALIIGFREAGSKGAVEGEVLNDREVERQSPR